MTNQHCNGHARAQIIADAAHYRGCRRFWAGGRQTLPWDYFRLARHPTRIRPVCTFERYCLITSTISDPAKFDESGGTSGFRERILRLTAPRVGVADIGWNCVWLIQKKSKKYAPEQLWLLELDIMSRPRYVIDFQIRQCFPIVDSTAPR